jgi:beta-glucosidase-like glycosyl hydrolase
LIALTSFLTEGQRLPPLILIERPGGASDALTGKAGFQTLASAREIGAQGDALEAFNIYQQLADSLSAAGIGMNLGPNATACPDDGAAPDCFGSEPLHSAAFATAFNLAHQSRGVLTGLRYVPRSGGLAALYEIMKRKAPDALIVGDDLEMAKTLRLARYSGAIILDRAAEAGRPRVGPILAEALRRSADMVLLRSSADLSGADLAAVRSAIDTGALSQARIEDAARRAGVLRMQLKATRSQIASQIGVTQ